MQQPIVRASTLQSRRQPPVAEAVQHPDPEPEEAHSGVPADAAPVSAPAAEPEPAPMVTRSKRRGPNKKPASAASAAAKAHRGEPDATEFANVGRVHFEATRLGVTPEELVERWRGYLASWDLVHGR